MLTSWDVFLTMIMANANIIAERTARIVGSQTFSEVEFFSKEPNRNEGLPINTTPPKPNNMAIKSNLLTDSLRKILPKSVV